MKAQESEKQVGYHGAPWKRTEDEFEHSITKENPTRTKKLGEKQDGCEGAGIFAYYGP